MYNKQMDIKQSDVVLILDVTDIYGEKLRVNDCATFEIRVFTNDPTHYLTFTRRDVISDEYTDKLPIDKMQLECLSSGTICFDYSYSKWNADFTETDCQYNHVKTIVTQIYWRNVINPENPCNVVNYETIQNIYKHLEDERVERIKGIRAIEDYVKNEYTNKLDAEVKRSNSVDIEFHKLIKSNKEDADNKNAELNDKLDKEIQRSNSVDTEIFNLIKGNADSGKETTDSITDSLNAEIARSSQKDADLENAIDTEVTRATNAETVIDTKLEGEIERAKTAEGAIRDAVENERGRAIAKETLINDSLTSEIARAKQVETDITTNLQALKTVVETEKQRSADKDTEHTNSLNQLSTKLDTETTRAKASEKVNADAIAILNGGEEVIGSIAHGIADAKHYTDDEIAKISANQNITLANFATKNEVAEVDGKLTAHIAASDAKFGEIYTKEEVDTIGNNLTTDINTKLPIDTFNQWTEDAATKADLTTYAKISETTKVKDGNNNVVTDIVINNITSDDSVELYTKAQCDENFVLKTEIGDLFDLSAYYTKTQTNAAINTAKNEIYTYCDDTYAKIWVGTQAEYDALETKNASTLYIIK